MAWREREIAAGRVEKPPEPWEIESPAVSLSLGDATDIDPAMLAAICGPDGLGGDALGPQFRQGAAADMLRPNPVLAALTEQACTNLSRLTDNQLIGALQAARRLENRAHYLRRGRSPSSLAAASRNSRTQRLVAAVSAAARASFPGTSWPPSCSSAGWRPDG